MTKKATPPSPRTQIRRVRERGHYDQQTIESIARESLICHIAFADDQGVHCIPTACWVDRGNLYIHGSNGSRMIQALMAGEASVTMTHLDGIVLARSAFHHSMNYRSVVAYGKFKKVESESEKMESFEAFIEFLSPGRWPQVRQPSRNELTATTVLRLPLTEAAAKIRNWGVKDDEADMQQAVWAGVIPLSMEAGKPEPDAGCEHMPAPQQPRLGAWAE